MLTLSTVILEGVGRGKYFCISEPQLHATINFDNASESFGSAGKKIVFSFITCASKYYCYCKNEFCVMFSGNISALSFIGGHFS